MNKEQLIARIDSLLSMEPTDSAGLYERFTGVLTLATLVYGRTSPQVRQLEAVMDDKSRTPVAKLDNVELSIGILRNLRAEIELGLVGDLDSTIAGEVLGDLLGLASEALGHPGDEATKVAAVLVAAAFEDTIRRLGHRFGNVSGRPKLSEVVDSLKEAGTLKGGDLRVANTSLSIRNDALHADWNKISRPSVASLMVFVQGLLSKHFS